MNYHTFIISYFGLCLNCKFERSLFIKILILLFAYGIAFFVIRDYWISKTRVQTWDHLTTWKFVPQGIESSCFEGISWLLFCNIYFLFLFYYKKRFFHTIVQLLNEQVLFYWHGRYQMATRDHPRFFVNGMYEMKPMNVICIMIWLGRHNWKKYWLDPQYPIYLFPRVHKIDLHFVRASLFLF